LLESKPKEKDLSSEDSSSDSGSNKYISSLGTQSKTEQLINASCSRTIDSDSESDESPLKANQCFEDTKKSGNKGMSLMVISDY